MQALTDVTMLGAAPRSVLAALLNRDTILADFPRKEELINIDAAAFYPIALYLELCSYLEERLGTYAFLRLGRKMGAAVMDRAFDTDAKTFDEAVAQIEGAHKLFCKPVVGGFQIVTREPGKIALDCTTPYNCVLQEGMFYEIAIRYGAPNATVTHASCRRRGAAACRFDVKY